MTYNKEWYERNKERLREYKRKYMRTYSKTEKYKKFHRDYEKNRREQLKREILKVLGNKCVICDYDKFLCSLDVHHIKFKSRELNTRTSLTRLKEYLEEVKKNPEDYKILCANCHRALTFGKIKLGD